MPRDRKKEVRNSLFANLFHHALKTSSKLLTSCLLIRILTGCPAGAQIGVSDTTATPVAGVPHEYLVGLGEVVSPANGSLSIRLKAPAPHERGVNWPVYIFTWDSASQYSLKPTWTTGTSGNGNFAELVNNGTYTSDNLVGWSAPVQFANVIEQQSITLPSGGNPPTTTTYYCDTATGYVFRDPDGGTHALGLLDAQTDSTPNVNWNCQQFNLGQNYTLGGDGKYKAYLAVNSTNFTPTATVVDTHGNMMATLTGQGNIGPWPYLAASTPVVEDTNGNYWNTTDRAWTLTTTSSGYDLVVPGTNNIPGTSSSYIFTTSTPVNASFSVSATAVNSMTGGNFCQVTSIPIASGFQGTLPGVVQTIEQPDGLTYSFQYDQIYGLINQITYPTGATVSYTWNVISNMEGVQYKATHWAGGQGGLCAFVYGWPAITKRVVSYNGQPVQEQDFQHSTSWPTAGGAASYKWNSKTTTVTTKDLIRGTSYNTVYTYSPVLPPPTTDAIGYWGDQGYMPVESKIQYYDTNGALLKTVNKVWQSVSLLTAECETLPNGQTSGKFYQYEVDPAMSGALNPDAQATDLPTDVAEWDYSSTAFPNGCVRPSSYPTRETKTAYWSFSPTPLFPVTSILDRPQSVQILGNNILLSETDYAYDEVAPTCISPAPYGHDEINYGCSVNPPRGNPTTVTRKCFVGSTNCTPSITKYTYDTTGQVLSETDGCGNSACADMASGSHTTQYSYNDNYTSDNGTGPGNTYAYVTKITRPSTSTNHISTFQYGWGDGKLRSETDENSNTTTFCYTTGGCSASSFDSFFRLTGVNHPDGGQETISYSDAGPNPTVTETILQNSSGAQIQKKTTYDEYGHAIQTSLSSDPNGPDYVETSYDGAGRAYQQSNPTRCASAPGTLPSSCSETTWGWTTYSYDAFGRMTQLAHLPDGSMQTWGYNSNVTTFTDEIGNQWQRTTDALGRLTSVLEPNGTTQSPTMETDYTYDALDNLLQVDQYGGPRGNPDHQRVFTYDSLSQLTQAYNPETNWICYGTTGNAQPNGSNCASGYDANGNLFAKTDARGVTVNYSYAPLNRLTGKTYSAPSPAPAGYAATTPVSYTYDQGSTSANPIGRLTGMTDATGQESWTYDRMGRVSTINRSILTPQSNQTGAVSFQYNPDGTLNTGALYTGTGYQYTYDTAGRPTGVYWTGSNPPTQFVSGATYDPAGHLAGLTQGGGGIGTATVITSNTYNNRLQPWIMSATGPGGNPLIYSHTFCYSSCYPGSPVHNDGNIQTDIDGTPAANNATYSYDTLNRLLTAQGPNWGDSYTYDSFGNLYQKTPIGSGSGEAMQAQPTSTNQLSGVGLVYDAAGNVLTDNFGTQYTYDAEERVATAGSWNYSYDGQGQRVLRTSGGTTGSTYWYGADGTLTDEQSVALNNGSPAQYERNLYLNGKLVVRGGFPSTYPHYYILPDQVGSSRVSVDFYWVPSTGQNPPLYTNYYPFGTFITQPTDILEQRFTGKERDTESGNDYSMFRYYSSSTGRWMSPDPGWFLAVHKANPQTWNMYSYVVNNPLGFLDPYGLMPCGQQQVLAQNGLGTQSTWCHIVNFFHGLFGGGSSSGGNGSSSDGSGGGGNGPWLIPNAANYGLRVNYDTGANSSNIREVQYQLYNRTTGQAVTHQNSNFNLYIFETQTSRMGGLDPVGDFFANTHENDEAFTFTDDVGGTCFICNTIESTQRFYLQRSYDGYDGTARYPLTVENNGHSYGSLSIRIKQMGLFSPGFVKIQGMDRWVGVPSAPPKQ